MRWFNKIALTAASFVMMFALWDMPPTVAQASTLTVGDQGQSVIDLQSRLGYLGYYHGSFTATYTQQTANAVSNFQSAFGIPATGQYDTQTAASLLQATAGWPGVGKQGPQINELQSRLKFLGYYSGPINGVYGWTTYWAVRDFQYAFGMPVNGALTTQTWTQLDKATINWSGNTQNTSNTNNETSTASTSATSTTQSSSPATSAASSASNGGTDGFSQNDITLMAHVVYGEARNQPFTGQVAVAAVILNRYHSNLFPHSIPSIIYQPGAFTSISNGQAWLGLHHENVTAVMDAIHGWDPTNGALYYWNPATATSQWIWSQPIMLTIGNHVFAK